MQLPNRQPIEKLVRDESEKRLDVHSIFYTIQGEGPFAGCPAVFIRLAGCNLQCPMCDTDYTSQRSMMSVDDIFGEVIGHPLMPRGLIVVTGGEPFRQPAIAGLLDQLVRAGFNVQVETNGTLAPPQLEYAEYRNTVQPHYGPAVHIVCSPKTGKVHPDIWARACCYKYVIDYDHVDEDDGLPIAALNHSAHPKLARPPVGWRLPIYVQPADHQIESQNEMNLRAAIRSCMRHGYTLQLQIHKLLGME